VLVPFRYACEIKALGFGNFRPDQDEGYTRIRFCEVPKSALPQWNVHAAFEYISTPEYLFILLHHCRPILRKSGKIVKVW
jgi:hypothetical protein